MTEKKPTAKKKPVVKRAKRAPAKSKSGASDRGSSTSWYSTT
jgi:hypothetical protein